MREVYKKVMTLSVPRRQNKIILGILIVLCIVLASFNLKYQNILPAGKSIILEVVSPLQKAVTFLINPFIKSIKTINKLSGILEENRILTEKVNTLLKENIYLKELERENRELRELLGSSYYEKFEVKLAKVIGKNRTDWKNSFFIDKGTNHNIKINMSVINQSGLIGRIITTSRNFSEVKLITDPNSSVAAMVQDSRKTGIIQGTGDNTLKFDLVAKEVEIDTGDIIITSGLGGIFPEGIQVGRVFDIRNLDYELYKNIKILPACNFDDIEEVLIITNFTSLD